MECLVNVTDQFDLTALLPKHLDGLIALQKEVHSDGIEDLLQ